MSARWVGREFTDESGIWSAKKLPNRMDDPLLLVFAYLREHGQGKNFASGAFGFREAAFAVAERLEGLLQGQGGRGIALRADLARGEKLAQLVPPGCPDHILMPHVSAEGDLFGQHQAVARIRTGFGQSCRAKKLVIASGHTAPCLVPVFNVPKLDREHRSLKTVHARVPAHFIVVIPAPHAMLAQHAHSLS